MTLILFKKDEVVLAHPDTILAMQKDTTLQDLKIQPCSALRRGELVPLQHFGKMTTPLSAAALRPACI